MSTSLLPRFFSSQIRLDTDFRAKSRCALWLATASLALLVGGLSSTVSAQTNNIIEQFSPPEAGVYKLKSALAGTITFSTNAPPTPWRVLLEGLDFYRNKVVIQIAAGISRPGEVSFTGSIPNDGTLHNYDDAGTNSQTSDPPEGYKLSLYVGDSSASNAGTLYESFPNYLISVTPDLLIPPVVNVVKFSAGARANLVTNANGSVSIGSVSITNAGQGYSAAAPPAFTFSAQGGAATNAAVTNSVAIDPVTGSLLSVKVQTNNTYASSVTNIVIGIAAPPRYMTQRTGGVLYGLNEKTGLYNYAYNSGDAVRFQTTVANGPVGEGKAETGLESRPLGPSDLYRLETVLTTDPAYQGEAGSDDLLVFYQDCIGDMDRAADELSEVRTIRTYKTPGPLPEYGVTNDIGEVYGARIYQPLPDNGYLDIGEEVQLGYDVLMPRNFSGIYFVAAKVDALNAIAEPLNTAIAGVYKESPPLQTNGLANNNTFVSDVATRIQVLSSSTMPNISIASQVTADTGAPILQSDNDSDNASVDEQGQFVVFESYATDLAVPQAQASLKYGTSLNATPPLLGTNNSLTNGLANGLRQIFRRNTADRSVEIVSVSSGGAQATADARNACVNADGIQVAFESAAPNLVDNDTGGNADVFVRDYTSYNTVRVSVNSSGIQGNAGSVTPSISGDGRFVAFASRATNLDSTVSGTSGQAIFVHDRMVNSSTAFDQTNNIATYAVSVTSSNTLANGWCDTPKISEDGKYVVFVSYSSNLPKNTNGTAIGDIGYQGVVYRVKLNEGKPVPGTMEAISVNNDGTLANALSYEPAINGDGSKIAFTSMASNLAPNPDEPGKFNADANGFADVFVRDYDSVKTANQVPVPTTVRVSESLDRFAIGHIAFPNPTAGDIPQELPSNNPGNDDRILLGDGSNSVTFRFSTNPVASGPATYDVPIGGNASVTRDNLVGKINEANENKHLNIKAVVDSAANVDGFYFNPPVLPSEADFPGLYLLNVINGKKGNVPITIPGITDLIVDSDGVSQGNFPSATPVAFRGMDYGGTEADRDAGEIDGVPAGSTMPSIDRTGMVIAFRSTMKTLDVYNRSLNGLNGLSRGDLMRMLFNNSANIYVRQRDLDGKLGAKEPDTLDNVDTERVSVDKFGYCTERQFGVPTSANSHKPALSANGRYVALSSDSDNTGGLVSGRTNLTPQDTNQKRDVFVYDRAVVSSPTESNGNNQPEVVLTEPLWLSGSSGLSVGSRIVLNAIVQDADEVIPFPQVQFIVNGAIIPATGRFGLTYTAECTIGQVLKSNSIRVKATDSSFAPNSTAFSPEINFPSVTPIPRPASATILPLDFGAIVEVGRGVELSARVGEPCDIVRFYADGAFLGAAGPGVDGVARLTWYPQLPGTSVRLTALAINEDTAIGEFNTLPTQNSPVVTDILGVDNSAKPDSAQAQVVDVFNTVLSRQPDGVQNQYWVDAVAGGTKQSEMVMQLIYEDEYSSLQNKLFGYYYKMKVAPVQTTYLNRLGLMTSTSGISTNTLSLSAPANYPVVNGYDAPYGATTGDATAAQKIVSSAAFAQANPGVQTKNRRDFMTWYFSLWPNGQLGPANDLLDAMNNYAPSTEARGYAASFINALYSLYGFGPGSAFDYQLKATSLQWLYKGTWQAPTVPPVTTEAQLTAFVKSLLGEPGALSFSPQLSATLAATGFSTAQGTPSAAKQILVSGEYLAGPATVAAEPGFEVSLDGQTYADTLQLSPQAVGTPVYVRVSALASAGSLRRCVRVSADGVASRVVELSADVSGNAYLPVADTYTGTFGEGMLDASFAAHNGLLSLATKSDGSFTGTLSLNGVRKGFSGKFASSGSSKLASVTVLRTGQSPVVVNLDFDTQRPTNKITGTVTVDDSVTAIVALPRVFTGTATSLHPKAGKRYSLVLPATDSRTVNGFASISVAANGSVSFTGQLGDGTVFSTSSVAVDGDRDGIEGHWIVPVYSAPYGVGGCLTGEIYIAKDEASVNPDVTGNLGWVRASGPSNIAGFSRSLSPLGQAYGGPTKTGLSSGGNSAKPITFTFDRRGLIQNTPITQPGYWSNANVPSLSLPVRRGLSFVCSSVSGQFTGTLRTGAGLRQKMSYRGVIFSDPVDLPGSLPLRGAGVVLTPNGPADLAITD